MMNSRGLTAVAVLGLLAVTSLLAQSGSQQAQQAQPEEVPPKWVQEDWAYITQGTGRWIADNTSFKSSTETFDAYGMEWKYGLGKKSLHGRLFAIRDGKELGNIWEFHSIWHPGKKQLMVAQVGSDGTLGTGVMTPIGSVQTESLERFFTPDGRSFQVAHRSTRNPGEYHTQSYDVSESGVWTERRLYIWKLQK